MSATASWYQPGRIVHVVIEGDLTLDDAETVNQVVTQYIREGQPPVHLLVEATRLGKFPLDLKRFPKLTGYLHEPNLGKMAVITSQGALTKFFASIITQAAHIEMKLFDKLDDGMTFLRRVDITLQNTEAT
jgi:hypothetical protein